MRVLRKYVEAVEPYVAPVAQLVALCGLLFSAVTQKQTERDPPESRRCNGKGCGVVVQRGRDHRPKIGIGKGSVSEIFAYRAVRITR